jgi:hypothetical protein
VNCATAGMVEAANRTLMLMVSPYTLSFEYCSHIPQLPILLMRTATLTGTIDRAPAIP